MYWQSTYGFLTRSLNPISQELSRILQIEWQERDSAAWGDYFLYPPFQIDNNALKETFKLYLNHRWLEGWKNPRFRKCGVLLTVVTQRPLEIDVLLFENIEGKVLLVQRKLLVDES